MKTSTFHHIIFLSFLNEYMTIKKKGNVRSPFIFTIHQFTTTMMFLGSITIEASSPMASGDVDK